MLHQRTLAATAAAFFRPPPKSTTCRSTTGGFLTEYASAGEARAGARHVQQRFGREMEAYQCGLCDMWHLAPAEPAPVVRECGCSGKGGAPKRLYRSRGEAEQRAAQSADSRFLGVYPCPETPDGWHITSL